MRRRTLPLLLAAVLLPPGLRAGDLQDDLKARRARVRERLGPEAVFVAFSAPERVYSRDVGYEYRQDSNLYYLTGVDQEDTTLVLMPGNATRKEILFVRPRDPSREHWRGRLMDQDEAKERSGVESVRLSTELEPFLDAVLSGRPFGMTGPAADTEFAPFFEALSAGRARLALVLDPKPGLSGPLTPVYAFAGRVRERFPALPVQDGTEVLRDLRQVKSSYEQEMLTRSVEISSEAHRAGMRAARPGAWEYEVEAAIEQVYAARGALGWGYPSIVASGPNATILHYEKSRRQMQAGELLLVDAACNYEYMTGDITRTYPVSGTYSPAQKDVYGIVLAAQDAGMAAARAGVKPSDVHQRTVDVIKDGLLKLGLITDAAGEQYRTWYTHGSVHFIGMDVHDVGDRRRPLEPGMAFVIEPGIYVQPSALDNLPQTPENAAFAEKVRPAFEKYKGIGVRIEDSFLLTKSGLKRLSASVPRTVEEVEAFLGSRVPPSGSARP